METPKYLSSIFTYLKKELSFNSSNSSVQIAFKMIAILLLLGLGYLFLPLILSIVLVSFLIVNIKTNIVAKIVLVIIFIFGGLIFNMLQWIGDIDTTTTSSEVAGVQDLLEVEAVSKLSNLRAETYAELNSLKQEIDTANNYLLDTDEASKTANIGTIPENYTEKEIQSIYDELLIASKALGIQIEKEQDKTYKVTKVVDGDTIKIMYDGKEESVRLIGIDTPETVHPTVADECYGQEASDKMKALVEDKDVHIMFDASQGLRDKYDRLLLYVWVDTTFVNEVMLSQGYASEYTYSTAYLYQQNFMEAENSAVKSETGLWGDACSCKINELSSECTACNIKTVETQNWDCSIVKEDVKSNNCSGECPIYVAPTPVKKTVPSPASGYVCTGCTKTCTKLKSCADAYSELIQCGCSKRDGDSDGVPCESLCGGG